MANRRRPAKTAYRAAQLAARQLEGRLRLTAGRAIVAELRSFADQLAAGVAKLPSGATGAAQSAELIRRVADRLDTQLAQLTAGQRTLSYQQVQAIWRQASLEVAQLHNLPNAMLGAVRAPPLLLLGAYENVGGAAHWRTLINRYVAHAADEANAIVRNGLLAGISPEQLARRLRPYVSGAETFYKAFGTLEGVKLAQLKGPEFRDAFRKLRYNSYRIAVSETHNARAEAEVQAFIADPLVKAVAWRLSPDRGTQKGPDECDALAKRDWWGLGVGIFPVDKVPLTPHPFDRCERVPITQDRPDPKPVGQRQQPGVPTEGLTKARAARLQARVDRLLGLSSEQVPLKSLRAHAETFAGPLGPVSLGEGFEETGALMLTLDEANAVAQQKFGVSMMKTEGSFENARIAANAVVQGLDDITRVGLTLPKGLRITLRPLTNGTAGEFERETMRVWISTQYTSSYEAMEAYTAKQASEGWWASKNARQVVHHEVGHALHYTELVALEGEAGAKGLFTSWSSKQALYAPWTDKSPEQVRAVMGRVSRYAKTSATEFVAETFAGMMNGIEYDAEVMTLYRYLKGPMPKIKVPAAGKPVAIAPKPPAVEPVGNLEEATGFKPVIGYVAPPITEPVKFVPKHAKVGKIAGKVPPEVAQKVRSDMRKLIRSPKGLTDEQIVEQLRKKYGEAVQHLTVADVAFRRAELANKPAPVAKGLLPGEEKPLTGREAEQALNDYFKRSDFMLKRTPEMSDGLARYQGSSTGINGYLRGHPSFVGKTGEFGSYVTNIDRAFEIAPPLERDFIVYRGVSKGPWLNSIGTVYSDPAYLSTSVERAAAHKFGSGVIMEIHVPRGTRGIWFNSFSNRFLSERELLLPRGLKLQVVEVRTGQERVGRRRRAYLKEVTTIIMRVVP